ncbi:MAG TPA: GAF domain-containing protein [Ktedonobacteraceae bacterium]|nr:GAF domain-containing protein [Ktedonobacteraceae bacterium]
MGILWKWNGLKWRQFHRLRQMFEVTLGLGIVLAASWYAPSTWITSHLIFCTVFLIVFATAIRYHTMAAYYASLLAAVMYGFLLWWRPEAYAQFSFSHIVLEASLLCVGGILASDLLRAQRRRFSMMARKYARAEKRLQKKTRSYQTLLEVNAGLEQQVSGLPASVATISEKMVQLWQVNGKERYSAVLDMITYAIEAQSCALYLQYNDLMQLCVGHSIDTCTHATILELDDPLISRVVQLRHVCTVWDSLLEEKMLSPDIAVMAGPLFDDNERIMGMVVVDSMPLLKFTPGTVQLFSSLLRIASIALQTVATGYDTGQLKRLDRDAFEMLEPVTPIPAFLSSKDSIS